MPLTPVTFDEKDLKKLFKTDTKLSRFFRRVRRFAKGLVLFALLYGIFFFAMNYSAFLTRFQFKTQGAAPIEEPKPLPTPEPTPVITYSPEINIPKLGVQAPAIYDASVETIIERLREGVVHYPGTALPGEVGNAVIVGHSSDFLWSPGNYKNIFALLDQLKPGDDILVPYGSERYIYKVSETLIVKPTTISVLNRTSTPTLTLITCYPVGTALNRLVVRATLYEGKVTGTQQTEPVLESGLPTPR